jgi:hypothetical protein
VTFNGYRGGTSQNIDLFLTAVCIIGYVMAYRKKRKRKRKQEIKETENVYYSVTM